MPSLLSNLKSAREYLSPTLKSSAFLTRGVLTPEEFVAAGDELVYRCPTWSWEAGDPSKRKKYLPKEKQYLVTRGVPCTARVSSLENVVADIHNEGCAALGGVEGGLDDDDGDWLVSRILTDEEVRRREEKALEEEFDILDGEGELLKSSIETKGSAPIEELVGHLTLEATTSQANNDDLNHNHVETSNNDGEAHGNDDEYADMADFEDDNVIIDEAAVLNSSSTVAKNVPSTGNNNILKVRTYDMSLTYDKYYQTPRVFLLGYSDDNLSRPLTGDEMMEDVIRDYANKTVTMEYHPHIVNGMQASIHPCQHGAVMKTIVKNLMRNTQDCVDPIAPNSTGPTVEMYLFIFLKFVSSMIPTINYDFTMNVSASTRKG